jgi:histone H3/H4
VFSIRKPVFQRLVRDISKGISPEMRMQISALVALQMSAEAYITNLFEECRTCCTHGKRVMVTPKDLLLTLRMRAR